MTIVHIIWKTPVVIVALLIGALAANQAGWSGAELVVNSQLMGPLEDLVTAIFFSLGAAVSAGTVLVVQRTAKAALWVVVPILLYCALVLGAWNGFAGDFDTTRLQAIKHHFANAYALEHMSPRARYRSCEDERIELTDDGKAACASALNVAPGEIIPGSEHRCGFLGMSSCVHTGPE